MRGIRQQHFSKPDGLISILGATHEREGGTLGSFVVKSALLRVEAEWQNLLTVAIGHADFETPVPRPQIDCGDFVLRDTVIDAAELFKAIRLGTPGLGAQDLPIALSAYSFSATRVPSRSGLSEWAGIAVEGSFNGPRDRTRAPEPFEPVVGSNGEYFTDVWTAASDWTGVRPFHGSSDSRTYGLRLFVPDPRARIRQLSWGNDVLTVRSEVRATGLQLLGGADTGRWERFALPLEETTYVQVPQGSTRIEIAVAAGDEFIDFFRPWHDGESQHVIEMLGGDPSDEASVVLDAIAGGEGATVEFKPFVQLGDGKKIYEVASTIVAFSNTSGGRVLVGVADHGEVEDLGASTAFKKWAKRDANEEVVMKYARQLRHRAIDACASPTPLVHARVVRVRGAWVAVLAVERGPAPPYSSRDGKVYVRRSATSRLAHPEREPEMFSKQHAQP